MIEKFIISNDAQWYEAFPDLALTASGRLVCVFSECSHHSNREYSCIMLSESTDRGRTWSAKRPLSERLHRKTADDPYWNCPRISTLGDGRLVAVADRIAKSEEVIGEKSNWLWFSEDEGATWNGPQRTPVVGIVPDKVVELKVGPHAGRWLLAAQIILAEGKDEAWRQRCWHSDDKGASWQGPYTVGELPDLKLCEGSIMELPDGILVCFLRENSGEGRDCYKSLSRDGGETWSTPVRFPLPGCHRPVAGMLQSGRVLITHRLMQGGKGWLGWWTQNFFAALTDIESCLAERREDAHTRILPLDFDRSAASDTGYSGWVQFEDGEIYVVNYIVDDAPKAHIRGYALCERDFLLDS